MSAQPDCACTCRSCLAGGARDHLCDLDDEGPEREPKRLHYHHVNPWPEQRALVAKLAEERREADRRKPTNPKEAFGIKKAIFSVIPWGPIAELGAAMLEGAFKYARHNYRVAGVRASTYFDALMRHMLAWWEGEDIDPDSGLPHLVKAMACLVVLRDAQLLELWTDDRPPKYSAGWMASIAKMVETLLERYPPEKRKEPITELNKKEGVK